ncbi:hypothetical protein BOTBODRAFT_538071 [Botryobasidium botryosum FD-172 SS1]|uniref:Uncharacterized protein n=1 Tax=Botryobasidium botryosum (strain FD-172 SS1) TaxID=930990 RepID=A0A067MBR5_BOTB1|nr:hypothetical protein BOTBODRAFT_538071 [Botryobasidium botryosum FD-172 SS1]
MSAPPPPAAAAGASTSAPVAGPSNLRQKAQPETPTHAQTKPFSNIPPHFRPAFSAGPVTSTPVVQRQSGPTTTNQPQPQLRTPLQTPAQKVHETTRAQSARPNQPLFQPPAPATVVETAPTDPPPRPPPQAERADAIQEDEEPSCTSYFGSEDDNFLAEMDLGIGGPIDFDEGLDGVEIESIGSAGSAEEKRERERQPPQQPEKEKDKGRSIARSIRAAVAEALGEVDPATGAEEKSGESGGDAAEQTGMRQPFREPQGRLVPIIDAKSTGSFSYPKLQGLNTGTKRGAESMGESSSVLGRRSGQAAPLGMMGPASHARRSSGGAPRYPLGELSVDTTGDVKRARR